MGLNDTVSAERIHIGFFGMRNAGKSSLVNAITNQELSVVSNVKGTTTDPVKKAMELLPLGPVLIIDTPGLDDEGELGEKRITKAKQILSQTDIGILVVDSAVGLTNEDKELILAFKERKLPYIIAYTKADLLEAKKKLNENEIYVSSKTKSGINEIKELIGKFAKGSLNTKHIVSDIISENDIVILVTPIDESAPKGRLILPQQQVLRELLDAHCTGVVCQPEELKRTISMLSKKPRLVITDSQVFDKASSLTPDDIPLTSFSILFARYKGNLDELIKGAKALGNIKSGDNILICEGCTHHRQCNDIGTVKIPRLIEKFTGVKPNYSFTSGGEFPEDLGGISLIVHCGGCMLNEKEMRSRIEKAKEQNIPIINYGILIAHTNKILKRALEPFDNISI